jgi:DNA-directed RNA polymerase III subunit RPC11
MELTGAVQCPNEKCRNHEAYWYQLQIRSADEPMTAFYKVSSTFEAP